MKRPGSWLAGLKAAWRRWFNHQARAADGVFQRRVEPLTGGPPRKRP